MAGWSCIRIDLKQVLAAGNATEDTENNLHQAWWRFVKLF